MCFRRTDTTVASDNLRDDQFKQRPALVSRGHTPFRPAHGPCHALVSSPDPTLSRGETGRRARAGHETSHAQHAKEVWPARFRTRNRNEAHTKKMTCRWSRACVRVGSWRRRNLYSPPLGIFSQRRRAATTTKQHDDSGVTEGEGLRGDTLRIGCSSGFWGDSATAGDMHDLFYILCLQYPHLLALARGSPFCRYMNNQQTNEPTSPYKNRPS